MLLRASIQPAGVGVVLVAGRRGRRHRWADVRGGGAVRILGPAGKLAGMSLRRWLILFGALVVGPGILLVYFLVSMGLPVAVGGIVLAFAALLAVLMPPSAFRNSSDSQSDDPPGSN